MVLEGRLRAPQRSVAFSASMAAVGPSRPFGTTHPVVTSWGETGRAADSHRIPAVGPERTVTLR